MTELQIGYLLDAVVTAPFAMATLIGSGRWASWLLRDEGPISDNARTILGALWMSILVCTVIGIWYPLTMAPVLILQLGYKTLWLVHFAVPRWLRGHSDEVPRHLAVIFFLYVVVYPWIIPWSEVFATPISRP